MTLSREQGKAELRERVWTALDAASAVEDDTAHGRIPAFHGAEAAARRLADLPTWRSAKIVKVVPDTAQEPVRALALEQGKVVYMAVPRLAAEAPFYVLDPARLSVPPAVAANRRKVPTLTSAADVDELAPVDLVVLGSVAVDPTGARIGKGAGYSDIEAALLTEAGLITERTVIVTTVHRLQVVNAVPTQAHDVKVDLIVTPEEVIACPGPRTAARIRWEDLPEEKIAAIPALAKRRAERS
ncbi:MULTISPECIES: 5-formyltetrahydrofolate cyclo-ligase [unclassified Kitasatospora]|uniref:5-formyltetrahydrofolate cyclo-ligase n=1 Tax=unclassified Kitasatospora TaxID=2633591 RepID=UPI0033CD075D